MVVQAESPPMAEDNVGVEADDKPELQPTTSTKKPPAKAKRVPRPKPRKPSPDAINEPDNLKRPNVVKEVEVAESDSYPQPSDGLNVNQLEVDVAEARLLLLDTKRDLRLARRAERATRRLERREHRRDRHLG